MKLELRHEPARINKYAWASYNRHIPVVRDLITLHWPERANSNRRQAVWLDPSHSQRDMRDAAETYI